MLSKNQIKFITSLHQKKYRDEHKLFIAEGLKTVMELIDSSLLLHELFTTEPLNCNAKQTIISENELKKISTLKTPNKVLAVFRIPESKPIESNGLILALDDVRDPGNLGTIIRLCDWFGIKDLLCSKTSADCFNPKVIQSTMGSIVRVNISYVDLIGFLGKTKLPKFGTFMDGQNVYNIKLPIAGILIMGNEANGISKEIENLVDSRIAIPRFGNLQQTESLNVATATAIFLSEFKRNSTEK